VPIKCWNQLLAEKELRRMKSIKAVLSVISAFLTVTTGLALAGMLRDVQKNGFVKAGVSSSVFGCSMSDEKGIWKGLDVDTARAIAAAVLGDASKVKFIPLTAVQGHPALQSKKIEVLCRNTPQTLIRETTNSLNFVHVNFYVGQGFLIPKKLGIKSAKELGGATVCVLPGTTTEMNTADFFREYGLKWKPVVIGQTSQLANAFLVGRCDVLTLDASQLAAHRSVAPNPKDYVLLPLI
jgi:general L-amino acid transport system substrate-binding protein